MSSQRSPLDESRLQGSSEGPKLINFSSFRPRMFEGSDELKIRNQIYVRRMALKVKEVLEENWINDFPYFSICSYISFFIRVEISRNSLRIKSNKIPEIQ